MSIANQETPVVDEKTWNAWVQKGKEAELRTARRMKIAAAAFLTILFVSAGVILLTK